MDSTSPGCWVGCSAGREGREGREDTKRIKIPCLYSLLGLKDLDLDSEKTFDFLHCPTSFSTLFAASAVSLTDLTGYRKRMTGS